MALFWVFYEAELVGSAQWHVDWVTQVWFARQGKAVVLSWDRHTRGGMARKGDRDQLAGFGHHKHEIILGSKERCGAGSRCLVRGRSQLEIKVWGSVWGWTGGSETCSVPRP